MNKPTPLEALRLRLPHGATVSYKDLTLRAKQKPRTGTVIDTWQTGTGALVVTLALPDSEIDTLPENVTLLRQPPHPSELDPALPG